VDCEVGIGWPTRRLAGGREAWESSLVLPRSTREYPLGKLPGGMPMRSPAEL